MQEYGPPTLGHFLAWAIPVLVLILVIWARQNRGGGWADERHVKYYKQQKAEDNDVHD